MSQDSLIFNGKKYISSRRAREITGYTTDYIGQLARSNKVTSRMVGRNRFVDENELLEYQATISPDSSGQTSGIKENQDNLSSQGFTHTSANTQGISDKRDEILDRRLNENKSLQTKVSFVSSLVVVILIGVFLNFGPVAQGFRAFALNTQSDKSFSLNDTGAQAEASESSVLNMLKKVDIVFLGFLDSIDNKIAIFTVSIRNKITDLFTRKPDVFYVDNSKPETESAATNSSANADLQINDAKLKEYVREIMLSERDVFAPGGPYGGIVVLPSSGDKIQDEILKNRIKDSFSDEVTVSFDSSGTSGVLRPVFKSGTSLTENYMFLLVPVEK